MEAVEFRAKIINGSIRVPRKYTDKVGSAVKVIVFSERKPRHSDIIDDLLKNPVKINSFKPFLRDEIYEGL